MNLLAKFNIVLITVFAIGLLAVCFVSDRLLKETARAQVVQRRKS